MKIAFDAKRVYQNATGLGNYSRTLVSSLATFYPNHHYYLCAPKLTGRFDISAFDNVENIVPGNFLSRKLSSFWRSSWVTYDLKKLGVDIYHGLSHEIPVGIRNTKIGSVVTIHDLIFERYPGQFNWIDVQIYRKKFRYACKYADQIIAISQQTKDDLINFYKIDPKKITVCYQSCSPAFAEQVSEEEKSRIKKLYNLPEQFFLSIGSIIERKNLVNVCAALHELKGKLSIPLIVIGDGRKYKQQVKDYITRKGLDREVIFLSETLTAKSSPRFRNGNDFPAIYQSSIGVIYPSIFEGFGIPVLEALWSQVPVITSNISCLPETGGDAAYYVNPFSPAEIAEGMVRLSSDKKLVEDMKVKGLLHAQKFTPQLCATAVMDVYLHL
jgi:glycosyltransferase involved in cell wall biosynthesis